MVVAHSPEAVQEGGPWGARLTNRHAAVMSVLRRSPSWIAAAGVFAATFLLRVVEPGFDNDHFRMMAEGRQVLLAGEAPHRDFADPGIFLQIYTSAALQLVFGYNLFGQALFGTLVLATAMALTFVLARRISGSIPIALVVTLLVVTLDPRLKQHHVVFLPVLGLLATWRYADRPTTGRLVVVALVTALAFLLRHDQGLYLGAAAAGTLLALHWRDGARVLLGRIGLYGAVAVAALLPFFAFLQANGGIVKYFESAGAYVRDEAGRQGLLPWPRFAVDLSAPLVTIETAPPPPSPRINVRWVEGMSTEARARLERRYQLIQPTRHEDPRGRTWTYELLDVSEANVTTLRRDRRIEETAGFDRAKYPPTGIRQEPFYLGWWRAVPLLGLRVLPGVVRPANAVPWQYYVVVGVPVLALLVLVGKRLRGEVAAPVVPKIVGAALMCLVVSASLRAPLSDRLADAAAPSAILAAWLLGLALMRRPPSLPRPTRGRILPSIVAAPLRLTGVGVALSLVGLTVLSVASLPNVQRRAEQAATLIQHRTVTERATQLFDDLRTPPHLAPSQGISDNPRALAQYVHECTRPTDRLLVTWFAPEIYFYVDRRFAGRNLFWFEGYYASPSDQARSVESLRAHPTPIVIHRLGRDQDVDKFEQVRRYIDEHYDLVPGSKFVDDSYQIFVDRQRTPTGRYEPLSLPCFS